MIPPTGRWGLQGYRATESMWKARLPTTSEHLRSPLRRRVAGEAGRRRSERWEGPRDSISGIRGCGVPSRFGRSLGSGICPGLRECGRFPLAPRCPRLASRGPHLAPSFAVHFAPRGKGQLRSLEEVASQELVWSPLSSLFLAGSQVCALRSRGATVRCSLRVWGDNKRRRVDGGSQTRQRHGERLSASRST